MTCFASFSKMAVLIKNWYFGQMASLVGRGVRAELLIEAPVLPLDGRHPR